MKRLIAVLSLTAVAFVGVPVVEAAAAETGAEHYCGISWGSQPKSAGPLTSPLKHVVNVRAGRHECFDRLVIDLDNRASGYAVRYVGHYRGIASGEIIPLPGGGKLEIIVHAPAVDGGGNPTYAGQYGQPLPGINLAGFQTFRSTRYGGTFEGQTSFGLGVRARLPFRVQKLGNRLVIDVAHRW